MEKNVATRDLEKDMKGEHVATSKVKKGRTVPSKKIILKQNKQQRISGNILRPLHYVFMQQNINLRRVNQKLQKKVKILRDKLKGGQTSLYCLAQVVDVNQ
jgi:hypothetical protein